MGLFDSILGGGSSGGLDAGTVRATVGYDHDRRGLLEWERAIAQARRESSKDVETELKGDFDGRGFSEYNAAVARSRAGSARGVKAAQSLERGILGVGKAAGIGGAVLGGVFVVGAFKAVEAASDLNESLNASNAIFEKSGPIVAKWSKTTADSLGLARSESLQAAASIGAMLKPMGFAPARASKMSIAMVKLAGDMASFNNEDPSEMLERIRSGLAGESEPLRRFGVDLRVSAVQAFALKEGLIEQGEALEGAALVQASYQKILADTADQQGDFARTSDGLANVQRRLRANFVDVGAALGHDLTPYVQEAAGALNDFLLDMKNGEGSGGALRRMLEGAGQDVAGFVEELLAIGDDPTKTAEQKLGEIFERISDVAVDGLEAAIPVVAGAAGRAAPEIAAAFVHGFLDAPILGKLLIANWAAKIFGGKTLLQRAGSTMGSSIAGGVVTGTRTTVASGGFKSRMVGAFGGLKSIGKGIGATVLAFGLLDGVAGGIETAAAGGSAKQSIHDGLTDLFGSIGIDTGPKYSEIFAENLAEIPGQVQDLIDQLDDNPIARAGARNVTGADLAELIGLPDGKDFDSLEEEQQKGLNDLADRYAAAGRLFRRTGIKAELDLETPFNPKDLDEFAGNLRQLKSGVFTTYGDISKASKRNAKIIGDNLGKGSKAGRQATAQNLRATAAAYGQAMNESGKTTKKGLAHIVELTRRADLIEGLHTDKFGKAFANAFGDAGKVTKKGIADLIADMKLLPKGQRQAAYDAMDEQLRVLRKQGKLSGSEYRKIRSGALAEFDDLEKGGVKSSKRLADGALGNFLRFGIGVANVLETNKINLNKALEAFEVDSVDYVVQKPKAGKRQEGGRAVPRFARGGFLKGTGREDTVPILAAPEEAFLTGHQQGPVELGLAASKAMGLQPYGSLDELFRRDKRSHRSAPSRFAFQLGGRVQKFGAGGMVDPAGPGTGVVNAAIADVVGAWSTKYDAAINYGYDPGGGHVSPGHNVTGTATDTGPAAGWGPGPTTLFEQGLRAVLAQGLTVLYGSHGVGTPYPNHGYGNHAHIEWGMHPSINGLKAAAADLAKIVLTGPEGPFLDMGNAISEIAVKGAQKYLDSKAPSGFDSGGTTGKALSGPGQMVGASVYGPPGTGTVGAYGSLPGRNAFAELGDGVNMSSVGTALGGLAPHSKLAIGFGGRSLVGEKLDVGLGGGDVDGYPRAVDLYNDTAAALNFGSGVGVVKVANPTGKPKQSGGRAGDGKGPHHLPPNYDPTNPLSLGASIAHAIADVAGSDPKKKKQRRRDLRDVSKWIKWMGLDDSFAAKVDKHTTNVNTFAEYADRANLLTTSVEDPTTGEDVTVLGTYKGDPEDVWLKREIRSMLSLRLALLKIIKAAKKRKKQIDKVIEQMRERVKDQLERASEDDKKREKAEAALKKAEDNGQDDLKKAKAGLEEQIKQAKKDGDKKREKELQDKLDGLEENGWNKETRELNDRIDRLAEDAKVNRAKAGLYRDKVLPKIVGQSSKLGDGLEESISALDDLQGIGSPMTPFVDEPAPGVLGGEFLSVQLRRREIGDEARENADDTSGTLASENLSAINELLAAQVLELQRDRNIRIAQEPIFSGLASTLANLQTPTFGGNFGVGGTVPGPRGAPRTIVAHGGEEISRPGDGAGNVEINVAPHPDGTAWVEARVGGVLRAAVGSAAGASSFPSSAGTIARKPGR